MSVRLAPPPPRRPRGGPVPLLVVLALLAGLLGAAALLPVTQPPAPRATATAAVVGAGALCPDLRQDGDRLRTRVSVGAVASGASGAAGALEAQALSADEAPQPVPVTRPGQVAGAVRSDVDGDALVVDARGSVAAGLEVHQLTRTAGGRGRGYAGLRCEPPRTDAWFLGGATTVGSSTLLLLANPDDTPAVVDVTVWTDSGPVDPRPGRGLVVAPHRRASVPLDQLAPDRDVLAVRVRAQRGRAGAALRHNRADGSIPLGVEWVPQSSSPAAEVLVPGVPSGPGRRTLQVGNPGRDDAVVRVELTTGDGQLVPPGLEALRVPAGTTVAADLSEAVATTPVAVRVTSDAAPVLAGVQVVDAQDGPVRELAYAGAAPPLPGPALVTDVVLGPGTESRLLLSAPAGDAAVDLVAVPVAGADVDLPAPRRVAVAGGTTVGVPLTGFLPASSSGLAVEVRPDAGGGPVLAARWLRERTADGPLTTSLALQGADARVPRPVAVRDPAAVVDR